MLDRNMEFLPRLFAGKGKSTQRLVLLGNVGRRIEECDERIKQRSG
jgi:hypothetical protein